jgi:hypothetical protein
MSIITLTKQGDAHLSPSTLQGAGAPALHAATLKDPDDAFDEVGVLFERFNDRLSFTNLALAKRYVEGSLNVALEARWGTIDFNIVFQRENGPKSSGHPSDFDGPPLTGGRGTDSKCAMGRHKHHWHLQRGRNLKRGGRYRNDTCVFVEDIKLMEFPKNGIPSFVWFKPKDEPLGLGANALYFGYASGFKLFSVAKDWKPVSSSICTLVLGADQVADKMIERGPQIVDDISENPAYLDWQGFLDANANDILAGIGVFISEKFIRVRCEEGLSHRLKLLNVAFGPFNF